MDPSSEPLTLTVEQAAAALGISRTLAYEAARTSQLPTIRVGRRLLVPRAALERLLASAAESLQNPEQPQKAS